MSKSLITLGLMSGTSMDGLDLCLSEISLDSNYNFDYRIIDYCTYNYTNTTKQIIKDAINGNNKQKMYADSYLGVLFANYSDKFLKHRKVDLIGSHGQTIEHVDFKFSHQVGNPKYLQKMFNVPVVYNFRKKDIDNGGNGAPLVPFLDWLLFRQMKQNIVSINIGGIANVTILKKNESMNSILGYDVGPGMCLIDDFSLKHFNSYADFNAEFSLLGTIYEPLLKDLLNDKFVNHLPPKSACRTQYSEDYIDKYIDKYNTLNKNDFLRTLVEFTAMAIFKNINNQIKLNNIDKIFISGGGKKHILLFQRLEELFKIKISSYKIFSINSDNKEAFLMAVLAVTRYYNINSNMMKVTGAKKNISCGEIYVDKN